MTALLAEVAALKAAPKPTAAASSKASDAEAVNEIKDQNMAKRARVDSLNSQSR